MSVKPVVPTTPVAKISRVTIEVLPSGGYFVGSERDHYVTPLAAFETFASLTAWLKKNMVSK